MGVLSNATYDTIKGKKSEYNSPCAIENANSYRYTLGKRHQRLRENVLKFSLRDMAEFYKLNKVTSLEEFENGKKELPLRYLEKIEKYFFIERGYLETGQNRIFRSFYLSQDSISKLMDDGLFPIIACCPFDRKDLFCYILLHSAETKFTRIIRSDRRGSFASSGGGRLNIQDLIYELLDREIPTYKVRVLETSRQEWEQLSNGTYYEKDIFCFGYADTQCNDIFNSWYEELMESRKRWQKYL